jgi:CSLREA domain-containing protein
MSMWHLFRKIVVLLILIALIVLPAGNAFGSPAVPTAGATVNVTTFDDEFNTDPAECALREAIYAVIINGDFSGCTHSGTWDKDTILLPAGTYYLTIIAIEDAGLGGDLDLYYSGHGAPPRLGNSPSADLPDITIIGDPLEHPIIDSNVERVFQIQAGVSVRFENLRIRDGYPYGGDPEHSGGGILNDGTLTMVDSTVQDNETPTTGQGGGINNRGTLTMQHSSVGYNTTGDSDDATDVADGGGIYNSGTLIMTDGLIFGNSTGNSSGTGDPGSGAGIYNSSTGTATLIRTTIASNLCGWNNAFWGAPGGGIYNGGTLIINTSTISWNEAGPVIPGTGDYGGGHGGGIYSEGVLTITNSTIANNFAGESSGSGVSEGGGVSLWYGTATLQNTILAGNVADQYMDCTGGFTSNGYNLVFDNTACSITGDVTTNLYHVDPRLSSLEFVDNVNFMHRLLWGSPAIDTGPSSCGTSDQRLIGRPIDGDRDGTATCDIGAYEVQLLGFFPLIIRP